MTLHSKSPLIITASLLVTIPAWAHEAGTASASAGWTWPVFVVVPLILTATLYGIGIARVWRRSGGSRRFYLELACFAAGWTSLLVALDSPIHEISEQLFWVHMTQHEILMLVSAPLLVLARPLVPMLW